MLHYRDRKQQVHILTLDPVLATDMYERLNDYPGMESVEVMCPRRDGSEITVDDINALALDTRASRVVIMDVRHQTLARLMQVYDKVVRFNRPDFNTHCYSVVIGDGPRSVSRPDGALGAFQKYLADIRVDYSPAAFFVDPFLHYSHEEIQELVLYEDNALPTRLPEHFGRHFKGSDLTVERARSYFRASGIADCRRAAERNRRQMKLAKFYCLMIEKDLPGNARQFKRGLTREGCTLPGESLRLNTYPFFFEQQVADLLKRATACAG